MGGWLAIGMNGGLRYPRVQFEPDPPLFESVDAEGLVRMTAVGAYIERRNGQYVQLRAFSPQPVLTVEADSPQELEIRIGNIHPEARFEAGSPLGRTEQTEGLERRLQVTLAGGGSYHLRWIFPDRDRYRFAAVGDSGAGRELQWFLQRAAEFGADFILHLGDLYYPPGTLADARAQIDRATIPVYLTIGNHEFHRKAEPLPEIYTSLFGPRNYSFDVLDTRFVSLDTAASTFPVWGGDRGRLLERLQSVGDSGIPDQYIVITHRPMIDPRPGESHEIGGFEAEWLHKKFLQLGAITVLSGHIHESLEFHDRGVNVYVAGEGLAMRDLPQVETVSRLLMGQIERGEPVRLEWRPLNMPIEYHCHPPARALLQQENRLDVLKLVSASCKGLPGWTGASSR